MSAAGLADIKKGGYPFGGVDLGKYPCSVSAKINGYPLANLLRYKHASQHRSVCEQCKGLSTLEYVQEIVLQQLCNLNPYQM